MSERKLSARVGLLSCMLCCFTRLIESWSTAVVDIGRDAQSIEYSSSKPVLSSWLPKEGGSISGIRLAHRIAIGATQRLL